MRARSRIFDEETQAQIKKLGMGLEPEGLQVKVATGDWDNAENWPFIEISQGSKSLVAIFDDEDNDEYWRVQDVLNDLDEDGFDTLAEALDFAEKLASKWLIEEMMKAQNAAQVLRWIRMGQSDRHLDI